MYIFAFLCLLRVEEVLQLRTSSIEYRKRYIIVTLNHRKNAQDGGMYLLFFALYVHTMTQTILPNLQLSSRLYCTAMM
jgi:hypothetical protein